MTLDLPTTGPSATVSSPPGVNFRGVVASEWLKLTSVRSTWVLAAVTLLVSVAGALLQALAYTASPDRGDLGVDARHGTAAVLTTGTRGAQLVVVVLAVLAVSAEYSTRSIMATFTAVPRRWPSLAGKALVVASLTAALGLVGAGLDYLVTLPMLSTTGLRVPADQFLGRLVLAQVGYLVAIALFALMVTAVVRHAAAAIALVLAVLLVLPVVFSFPIPGLHLTLTHFLLPYGAGMVTAALYDPAATTGLAGHLAVALLWLGMTTLAAVVTTQRRNA